MAGLIALGVAWQTGPGVHAEELLSAHMTQHTIIWLVACPLLACGAPVRLALKAGDRRLRRVLTRLHLRVTRFAAHPLVALLAFVLAIVVSHVTPLYSAALGSSPLHAIEYALYLWSGLLFWVVVVRADPLPHRVSGIGRLGLLLGAMFGMASSRCGSRIRWSRGTRSTRRPGPRSACRRWRISRTRRRSWRSAASSSSPPGSCCSQ